jgi:anti-anti-sigma factor
MHSTRNTMANITTVVTLNGEYDASRRDELDHLLDRYGDTEELVFDLHEVDRLDSSALRSLVRFQRARKEAGKSPIVLVRPTPAVRDFIEMAELDHTFSVRDSL